MTVCSCNMPAVNVAAESVCKCVCVIRIVTVKLCGPSEKVGKCYISTHHLPENTVSSRVQQVVNL